jgi:hypothetical protein
MTPVSARHEATVGGRVRESESELSLAGVRVRITSEDGFVVGETMTGPNGLFSFLDVPAGAYNLTASMPRSGTRRVDASENIRVESDPDGRIKRVFADLTLGTTTVQGVVKGSGASNPVIMAQVRVKGSGERTFTDREGHYRLSGLEAGKRVIQVTAPGFRKVSKPVTLSEAGVEQTLDFKLPRSNESE